MVRVRMKQTGTRNASCFRIVVMDERSSRDGKAIEELGYYNPRRKEEKISLERLNYWKSVGAQISDTVSAVASRAEKGVSLKDKVKKASPSKKVIAAAKAAEEAKAKAAAEAQAAAEKAAAEAKAAAEKAAEEAKAAAETAGAEAQA